VVRIILHLSYSSEPVMRLDCQILLKSPPPLTYWLDPPLLPLTPLIFCGTDFVSAIKPNVSIDLCQKFLMGLSNKIVGLDLAPFSKMALQI